MAEAQALLPPRERMTRVQAIFPALLVAFTGAMLALGYFHYHYSWTSFAFPLIAGLVVIVLCAGEMLGLLRHPETVAQPADQMPAVPIRSLLWLFALGPFLWAFGFVFGAALYLLISMRGHAFSWRAAIMTALVSLLVSWGLVIEVLGVQLPIRPVWMG
jgi:hypothetical protein